MTMMHKDPTTYSIITYIWVIAISISGGFCHHLICLKKGVMTFRLTALLGDLFISSFAGLMTFYLCEASEIHGPLQAVLVGTSGHMGSRTIFILENSINQWLSTRFERKVVDE